MDTRTPPPREKAAPFPGGAMMDSLFVQIVDQLREGVVVLDENATVQYANQVAVALLREVRDPLVGDRFPFSVPLRDVQEIRLPGTERTIEMLGALLVQEQGTATVVYLRDVTDEQSERKEWEALCLLDELTGLYNRRGLTMLAKQQMKMASRLDGELYLIYADLDGLKRINDVLGHREGDRALKDVAQIIVNAYRESDVVARIGGDEFVLLALGSGSDDSQILVQRLYDAVEAFNSESERPYRLSVSVGAARYSRAHPCTLEELLHRADTRMYMRKREKRNSPLKMSPGIKPTPPARLFRRGTTSNIPGRNARRGLI